MNIEQEIKKSEKYIQWLDCQIDGLNIPREARVEITASCLDIALEHQKAIILLVAHRWIGSAYALMRCLSEAYTRGLWLHRCATDTQLKQFEDGLLRKPIGQMIKAIEQVKGFESGVLSRAKDEAWNIINDFTHTGFQQIIRRHTGNTIEPNYDREEVLGVIDCANAYGTLAAIETTGLVEDAERAYTILSKWKELWE